METPNGYDIIDDIHGQAGPLVTTGGRPRFFRIVDKLFLVATVDGHEDLASTMDSSDRGQTTVSCCTYVSGSA